jgi:hypothetical protein
MSAIASPPSAWSTPQINLVTEFRTAGLTHFVAVSGDNVIPEVGDGIHLGEHWCSRS